VSAGAGDARPQAPEIGGDRWPRIIEQLEDGLLVLDRSGTIRYANAAAAALLGRSATQLVGAPFGLPLTGPGVTELELGPQGTPVRLRIVDAGLPDDSAWLVTLRDQSVQRALFDEQRATADARSLIDAAVRIARIGTWHADLQADRLDWSARTMDIFGVTPETFGGTLGAFLALVHPDDRARVVVAQQRAARNSDANETEYRIRRPSGEERWIVQRGEVVGRGPGGEATLVVGVVLDDTDRRRLLERAQQRERLESLGTLTGGIAHHLNNLLSPILLSIDLLRHDPAGPDAADTLAMVEDSARRAALIIRQMLEFSGGGDSARSTIDLCEVARGVADEARTMLPASISLDLTLPEGPARVRGDAVQLRGALLSLVQNAGDAMRGQGAIHLRVRRDLPPPEPVDGEARAHGAYVAAEVVDSGPGIPVSLRQRVFDPFYTSKGPGQGTGLGLSTAAAIAGGHGGQIVIDDAPGGGARVALLLPAATEAASDATALPPAGDPSARPAPNPAVAASPHPIVLVVDDEESIRGIVDTILRRAGITARIVADGAAALDVLGDPAVDIALLLTDVRMPGMDGPALARLARSVRPALPIIAMSGEDEATTIAALGDLPVARILNKPFTVTELLAAVRAHLPA
jgi:PAS domain S-box-containing protein